MHPQRRRGARHRRRRAGARVQRPRQLPLHGRASASARGPASSTAWACGGASSACDGTNVNELTSQRLTDIGRAPTFYDCLVEVQPARRCARVRRCAADGGSGHRAACCWPARHVCLTSGCSTLGYYAPVGRRPPRSDAARAAGRPSGWPTADAAEPLKRAPGAVAAHPRLRRARAGAARQRAATAAMPTSAATPRCGTSWPRRSCR